MVLHDGTSTLIHNAGSIAGPDGCLVKVSDAIKKPWPDISFPATPPQPTIEATA